jgi:hypothetical protein
MDERTRLESIDQIQAACVQLRELAQSGSTDPEALKSVTLACQQGAAQLQQGAAQLGCTF